MYIARTEDEACYCHENVCEETGRRANSRWKCSNCRKHEGHQHCDQCHACMGDEDGLCESCAAESTKVAPAAAPTCPGSWCDWNTGVAIGFKWNSFDECMVPCPYGCITEEERAEEAERTAVIDRMHSGNRIAALILDYEEPPFIPPLVPEDDYSDLSALLEFEVM